MDGQNNQQYAFSGSASERDDQGPRDPELQVADPARGDRSRRRHGWLIDSVNVHDNFAGGVSLGSNSTMRNSHVHTTARSASSRWTRPARCSTASRSTTTTRTTTTPASRPAAPSSRRRRTSPCATATCTTTTAPACGPTSTTTTRCTRATGSRTTPEPASSTRSPTTPSSATTRCRATARLPPVAVGRRHPDVSPQRPAERRDLRQHGVRQRKRDRALLQQNRGAGNRGRASCRTSNVHDNTIIDSGITGAAQDNGDNAIFTSRNNRFQNNHLQGQGRLGLEQQPIPNGLNFAAWQRPARTPRAASPRDQEDPDELRPDGLAGIQPRALGYQRSVTSGQSSWRSSMPGTPDCHVLSRKSYCSATFRGGSWGRRGQPTRSE